MQYKAPITKCLLNNENSLIVQRFKRQISSVLKTAGMEIASRETATMTPPTGATQQVSWLRVSLLLSTWNKHRWVKGPWGMNAEEKHRHWEIALIVALKTTQQTFNRFQQWINIGIAWKLYICQLNGFQSMPRTSLTCLMNRLSEAFNEYLKASTVTNPNSYPPPHPHPHPHPHPQTQLFFHSYQMPKTFESSTVKWQ